MSLKKAPLGAALVVTTTFAVTAATAVLTTTAAYASTTCSFDYGNTRVTATFTFSNRNVSADWTLTAASGSNPKRVGLRAWNSSESSYLFYARWVAAGTSGSGTLSTSATPAQTPGGYTYAQVLLYDSSSGTAVKSVVTDRAGSCKIN